LDRRQVQRPQLPVIMASVSELAAHEKLLDGLEEANGTKALWRADPRPESTG